MNRFLLDTHVVLWWLSGHSRIDESTREAISRAECYLSAASIWEVAIKFKLGKLDLSPDALIAAARQSNIRLLSVTPEHGAATATLPAIHSDPFDRLLIAQARLEKLRLLTADSLVARYDQAIVHLK
jgi:PIN domain nuclease of toxin-antitoxin system